jgi:iron complex transport system ATP-binding protein
MSLEARGIDFRRGERTVLSDVHFALQPGEFVALLGSNGAGKSTLLRTLSGELSPRSGGVFIDGQPLASIDRTELARRRTVLGQHPAAALDLPVEDIVALGRSPYAATETRRERRRIVMEMLERVGALSFASRSIQSLSGGEAQRVHLARALAQVHWPAEDSRSTNSPRYLLLDEPFSALDISRQHDLVHLVRAVCGERVGVLAILHDLNLAAHYADRLVIMRDGRIMSQGPPDEILQPQVIHDAFGVASSVCQHPHHRCPVVILHGHPRSEVAAG